MLIESASADHDLAGRVSNYLGAKHIHTLRELDVVAKNGTVTLKGKVRSFHEKQVALHSCQRVAGVVSLVDEVTVCG